MRFPRNSKIFRGQVDAAPFAGVFFLLLLFLLLFHTHVFIPGVQIDLGGRPAPTEVAARTVKVLQSGSIEFEEGKFSFSQLRSELLDRAQKGTLPGRVIFESEPGTRREFVDRVEQLVVEMGVRLKLPGTRLELPEPAGFEGSPKERVVVAINLNGQIFYQHQLVSERVLLGKLIEAVKATRGPLTLVVQADKMVPVGKFMKVCEIARDAKIAEVTLAHRPNPK